jgi:hypothetical protein
MPKNKLPDGYTVDEYYQQFRFRDTITGIVRYIPFDSPEGKELLAEYRKRV